MSPAIEILCYEENDMHIPIYTVCPFKLHRHETITTKMRDRIKCQDVRDSDEHATQPFERKQQLTSVRFRGNWPSDQLGTQIMQNVKQ